MISCAEFARNRPKDAGANRLRLIVEQHRRIGMEPYDGAVRTLDFLSGAHNDCRHHIALFDASARDRLLDRNDDRVTNPGIFAFRAAEHFDAHDTARARIIGDVEVGLHLNHRLAPYFRSLLRCASGSWAARPDGNRPSQLTLNPY